MNGTSIDPYAEPTPAQFVRRFPEFENVEKPVIQTALDDATASVSTSWADNDYQPAIMFLAAHYLAVGQMQINGGQLNSVTMGSIALTYVRNTTDTSLVSSTAYGQRFAEIRARNIGGLVVQV
jgi:hypothetical protein